jgi:isocitrate dehydrogenase (NAD+)
VNPTSILISSIMMLRYLGLPIFADKISASVQKVLTNGKIRTIDIGGNSTT